MIIKKIIITLILPMISLFSLSAQKHPAYDKELKSMQAETPESFTAIAVSGTQVNMGWLYGSKNADSFKLERSIDGTNFSTLATVTGTTTYSDTGLDPQKTYYYCVAATNEHGSSDFTAAISETVKAANEFTVMSWNIWKRSDIDSILTVINHISPDILLVQEQGFNDLAGTTYDRDQTIMQGGGFAFGQMLSSNLAIFSKFPVSGYVGNTSVSSKQHIMVELPNGKFVRVFNGWLHYLPDYMGTINNWDGVDGSVTPSGLIQTELYGERYKDAGDFVSFIQNTSNGDLPVICGGDFNSGSHLDWIEATKNLNHKGLVIEWPVSKLFTDNSFTDSYRIANPDPVTVPGFTWNQSIKDRIDYIYYKGAELEVKNSIDFKRGCTGVINTLSDHEPVVTTFRYLKPAPIIEASYPAIDDDPATGKGNTKRKYHSKRTEKQKGEI